MLSGTRIAPPQIDDSSRTEEAPLRARDLAELGLDERWIWGRDRAGQAEVRAPGLMRAGGPLQVRLGIDAGRRADDGQRHAIAIPFCSARNCSSFSCVSSGEGCECHEASQRADTVCVDADVPHRSVETARAHWTSEQSRRAFQGIGGTTEVQRPAVQIRDDLDHVRIDASRPASAQASRAWRSMRRGSAASVAAAWSISCGGRNGSSPWTLTTMTESAHPRATATAATRSVPDARRRIGQHGDRRGGIPWVMHRGCNARIVRRDQHFGCRARAGALDDTLDHRPPRDVEQGLARQTRRAEARRNDDAELHDQSLSSGSSAASGARLVLEHHRNAVAHRKREPVAAADEHAGSRDASATAPCKPGRPVCRAACYPNPPSPRRARAHRREQPRDQSPLRAERLDATSRSTYHQSGRAKRGILRHPSPS